ncbi:MAG TPA: glycosyltransferase, partial [Gemmataceae bacterium]|nr:glycosyltransferase [Gemmataceae bacterium]
MTELKILPLRSGPSRAAAPSLDSLYAALVEKERTVAKLQGNVAARGHLLEAWRRQLATLRQTEQTLRDEIASRHQTELRLWDEIRVRHEAEGALRDQIIAMTSTRAWRLIQRLRRSRLAVAPPGTWRDRAFRLLIRALRVWWREGALALGRKAARKLYPKCVLPLTIPLKKVRRALSICRHEGLMALCRRIKRKFLGQLPSAPPPTPVEAPAWASPDTPAVAPDPNNSGAPPASKSGPPSLPPLTGPDITLLTDILGLPPRHGTQTGKPIDVIIPVYKGLTETLRCLQTVLSAKTTIAHEVVVINDSSPDLLLACSLRMMSNKGLITLLENPVNLGFVQTINRGLALHPERDVLLLNSDTEVYNDWLDRLHRAAYAARDVGTVTPLSNNATICSYPRFCEDNPIPEDLPPEQLDVLCASINASQYVDVPTAVGFCMYIRRDCLDQVGILDAEHFGKGYGEENDFCMRAAARGWRHLLTADTFVRHLGGTSFGAAKNPAVERALKVLDLLHPDYGNQVGAHLMENPALPLRRRLDLARLVGAQPAILYISHSRGGGTERHVVDMATRLQAEGCRALILRPVDAGHVSLEQVNVKNTPNLVFAMPEEYWTLREALLDLGVEHIHVHHIIGLPAPVLELIRDLGLPYDWTVHDYYPICPRINLIDETGSYCGEPEPSRCNVCLEKNGGPLPGAKVEIQQWRRDYGAWLAGARKVMVPHRDVAVRLARYFPDVQFTERRHLEALTLARPVSARYAAGEVLRVAIIGMIGVHKGSEILLGCARDAAA